MFKIQLFSAVMEHNREHFSKNLENSYPCVFFCFVLFFNLVVFPEGCPDLTANITGWEVKSLYCFPGTLTYSGFPCSAFSFSLSASMPAWTWFCLAWSCWRRLVLNLGMENTTLSWPPSRTWGKHSFTSWRKGQLPSASSAMRSLSIT